MDKRDHGGNVHALARERGISKNSIIDFSANINPLGYPDGVRRKVMDSMECILTYPDPDSHDLTRALAEYHGIAFENILVGNGATEFIYWLPLLFRPQKALIVTPAFSEYEKGLLLAGADITFFQTRREEGFHVDTGILAAHIAAGIDMVCLGNPASPSGVLTEKERLYGLIGAAEQAGTLVVIDEAFMDFVEGESVKKRAVQSKSVVILRSMTKFFGIPGLRVGYCIADAGIIARIRNGMPPWTVNAPAQLAAAAALSDSSYIRKSREYMKRERPFLESRLSSIEGFCVMPGVTNYLLVYMDDGIPFDAPELRERMLASNIAIRDCSHYRGLDGRFFRVAVKRREENMILVDALREVCP